MVDVGGAWDGDTLFDHHYVGAPVREDGSPYAAAGLVARAFRTDGNEDLSSLIRRIDLADNGLQQELQKEGWTLSATVHKCNPLVGGPEEFDRRFNYLVELAAREIELIWAAGHSAEFAAARFESDWQVMEWVKQYEEALAASAERIREAFKREGPVAELAQYEPALMGIAHEAPEGKLYSIFPNPGGEWMVQQIPLEPNSPKGRKPLPESWAGRRGADLDAVTGIEGCVFCHPARFIGGHKSLDGARQMASLAVTA